MVIIILFPLPGKRSALVRQAPESSALRIETVRFRVEKSVPVCVPETVRFRRRTFADFEAFFGMPLKKAYGLELALAKALGFVTERDGEYALTLKGAFYYHYYEHYYTLAYIDKMWGIMRREAFPEKIEL